MKRFVLALLVFVIRINFCSAQQTYYDITPGNGYGLRFWSSDQYKIHMGVGSEYSFGPVNDYSIKSNMDLGNGTTGRGWTWGRPGMTPIAALNLLGNMQIAGSFQSGKITATGSASSEETILNATNWADQDFQVKVSAAGAATKRTIIGPSTVGRFSLGVNGANEYLTVVNGGNVGIGTTTPSQKLEVNGTILSTTNYGFIVAPTSGDAVIRRGNPGSLMISSNGGSSDVRFNYSYGGGSGGVSIFDGGATNNANLSVNSSGNLSISSSGGNVGIGTTIPARPLHINNNGGGIIRLQSQTAIWDLQSDAFYNGNFGVVNYTGGVADATRSFMINGTTGNVGVGTANPGSYKLAVEGKIGAREVNVIATNPWPDYVFDKNYRLPSLDEIKNYIDQNNHLPEVPSAQEVEKNGVNLGEMNALLLKKIEELTLYVIELKQRDEAQQKEIEELKEAKSKK